ncbi:SOS response-associated peptidase [Candidatus Latescibacterota bacterium]
MDAERLPIMCGRFALPTPAKSLAEHFSTNAFPEYEPRYNIAPSQMVPAVIHENAESGRSIRLFRWGLIPFWAKDTKIGYKLINARAETLSEKPSFKAAYTKRRCLIPTTGFYEWKKDGKEKQPYYFHMRDNSLFGFAGLWERWKGEQGLTIDSCTIITTTPNDLVGTFHNRMPVILDPADYDSWLNMVNTDTESLQSLLIPFPADMMASYPVNMLVNSPKNEGPECIERIVV